MSFRAAEVWKFAWTGWLIMVLMVFSSCVGQVTELPAQLIDEQPARAWQVIDTGTGRAVSPETWLAELTTYDVVYLGEEHHNRFHIEAALKVLRAMLAKGREPVIAMEMFGWDGQKALDRYVINQEIARAQFLDDSQWTTNWGGSFEDYEPLIALAKEHRLTVRAMNPPRSLVRRVVKLGLEQAQAEPEMAEWGMKDESIVDDPAYRTTIIKQLRACHGGGMDSDYAGMYEASMFRDEGMAKTIVDALRTFQIGSGSRAGPILSYTGGGHVQYGLPVPKRVARRQADGVRQVTIYLTSFESSRREDIEELVRDRIADFVWLTPVSSQGPPRRCR